MEAPPDHPVAYEHMFGEPVSVSHHPADVGLRSEAAVLAKLVACGYRVLLPFGSNQRYDLVIHLADRFVTAQCKTGRLRRGCVVYSTASVRSNTQLARRRSYAGEVDVFLVYCPDTEEVYVIPIDEVPEGSGSLRVSQPANNQRSGIRWAADYALREGASGRLSMPDQRQRDQ